MSGRIITLIVLIAVLAGNLPLAKKAEGQILTFETNPVLIAAATNTSAQTTALTIQDIAKQAFLIATEALKRRLLTMVTDQIINWIEGGGSPKFITDWKGFLADVGSVAVGDLAIELGAGFLCSPFGFQVRLLLARPPRFTDAIMCTLDDIVNNIQNFYDDFRNGGWLAYSELIMPHNNYYGAVLLALQEKYERVAAEKEAGALEALAGNGFLGTRRCDSTGRFCTITTPGAAISYLAARTLSSDLDYLINAQDLAVYVGAIADALINRLVRSGAEGLISLTTPNKPSGGYISGGGACAGLTGTALTNCQAVVKAQSAGFSQTQKTYLAQIDGTLTPLKEAQAALTVSANNQYTLADTLSQLYYCQVGLASPEADATLQQLQRENDAYNQLSLELGNVSRDVDSLAFARDNIQNPPIKETTTIAFYYNNIAYLLDKDYAESYKQEKEIQQDKIQQKIGQDLPVAQQQLTSCRGF